PDALKMALKLTDEEQADMVIGTDPDSDRLGIAVRDDNGEMVLLNGNQTMILMTDFLLKEYKAKNGFNNDEFIASTVVSTPMMSKLADHYGVECKLGLTGFKWIAKMIKDYPQQTFVGGGEESFGYMVGDFVRDKDAVTSTLLACTIGAQAKEKNSSFYQELLNLYVEHGLFQEKLISLVKKGISGAEEIKTMMTNLRENPPREFNNTKVVLFEDYQTGKAQDFKENSTKELDFPKSNVLIFYLEDGTKIAARPSGTEPKIKFYVSVNGELDSTENYKKTKEQLENKIDSVLSHFDF
ncbi:MAG TPA: phospho-sugar mutase, partial [Flavobacteriaceae bacterium]|nr:phospho-sugar mutase [Flavobacteriaceae bacterium]